MRLTASVLFLLLFAAIGVACGDGNGSDATSTPTDERTPQSGGNETTPETDGTTDPAKAELCDTLSQLNSAMASLLSSSSVDELLQAGDEVEAAAANVSSAAQNAGESGGDELDSAVDDLTQTLDEIQSGETSVTEALDDLTAEASRIATAMQDLYESAGCGGTQTPAATETASGS